MPPSTPHTSYSREAASFNHALQRTAPGVTAPAPRRPAAQEPRRPPQSLSLGSFCKNKMRTLALIFFLAISGLRAEDTSTTNRDWVAEAISAQYGKFHSVSFYPCPSDKTLLAAYCEREEAWWGHMRVFKQSGDRVEWAATFPEEYIKERGHYVVSSRWMSLPMLENPVLELIESTHMGNGSLWLLELNVRDFRVILHTPVRGRFWSTDPEFEIPINGEARFAGSHLRKCPGSVL